MITIYEILGFIYKAINDDECVVQVHNLENSRNIFIGKKDGSSDVVFISNNTDSIRVTTKYGYFDVDNIPNVELAKFNVLYEECIEHIKMVGMNEFENFFKDENTKPTDINDLDDD